MQKYLLRKKRQNQANDNIFPDINVEKPKLEKIRPWLRMMLAMGEHEGNWRFGGPLQIKLLLSWNRTNNFRCYRRSSQWARAEVENLWNMQRVMDDCAGCPHRWKELVVDDTKFQIPQNRGAVEPVTLELDNWVSQSSDNLPLSAEAMDGVDSMTDLETAPE